jgi:ubiquinone/menaquinone biosynthesis C-methylase UbiE
LVLDPWFAEQAQAAAELGPQRVLDVGCGTGTLAFLLAHAGHHVTALDTSRAMIERVRQRLATGSAFAGSVKAIHSDLVSLNLFEEFDWALLNLVLDHVAEPAAVLAQLRRALVPGARLTMAVPHPVKDAGRWVQEAADQPRSLIGILVRSYFDEGATSKARFDDAGNVVIPSIVSFRRTTETYFRLVRDAGFVVRQLLEPAPAGELARHARETGSLNYLKCSQIPYFLILDCEKPV